ncbi:MAG: cellulose biosynthesis cyclic di-GMP-binding regulatory protein BcsB, partial [Chloroflexi bacterium]|nr:cellulose biosynthesis cyclic di-GMP-binding regulatory protein BcsB [Chloroflexota bacterium]
MNKLSHKLILFGYITFSVFMFLLAAVSPGYAQTPEPVATSTPVSVAPTPVPTGSPQATAVPFGQSPPGITEVTFTQLDQSAMEMRSPLSQQSFTFNVPYRWVIVGDESFIELHYDWYSPVSQTTAVTSTGVANVLTEVYFNNGLATSFRPTAGSDQTIHIPIPPSAVNTPDQDQYEISIIYFSENCDNNQSQSTLVIHDHSFIHFNYTLKPLQINLADFPRPLVQNLFSPESILLVIPDAYSDADLATAASVAAALGQRTFNTVAIDIVTAAEATPERLANTNAIIIGQPNKNAFLLDLYQRQRLPTTLADNDSLITGPVNQPISADDGVLQEIPSDYSNDQVYLIVTGNSDTAVAHAAQTLSVLSPRYGIEGNLVVVADFRQFLPPETAATDRFTLLVELNNKPVGSAPIDQNALGDRQAVIELSKSDFIPGGRNRFNFAATMNMSSLDCALLHNQLAWLRLREDSQLYLPHIEK